MKVVSVINYKGGVGKTTVTANLAAFLAGKGKRILIIDLDPQASLTFSFFQPEDWDPKYAKHHTIRNWFSSKKSLKAEKFEDLIIQPERVLKPITDKSKGTGTLKIISSHLKLINVDLELATELGGSNMKLSKEKFLKVHGMLSDGIKSLGEDYFDLILIDCPPNFNIITKNAIVASDFILVPAKPDYLSTLGIDYLKNNLDALVKEYNDYATHISDEEDEAYPTISPSILGVLFTMIQVRNGEPITAQRKYIKQTEKLGIPIFETIFRENKTIFADAPSYGVPVSLNDYSNPTYFDVVSEIRSFVSEFSKKVSL